MVMVAAQPERNGRGGAAASGANGASGTSPPRKPAGEARQKTKEARESKYSAEPLVMPFKILHDTRERAGGWRFTGLRGDSADKNRPLIVPTAEKYLTTADYTIEGCPVFIERKSLSDFVSTITHGHANFVKEHERMRLLMERGATCAVVIEGSYERLMDELESGIYPQKVHSNSVRGACAALPSKFHVPWHWAGSRRRAEELSFWIMRRCWERMQG